MAIERAEAMAESAESDAEERAIADAERKAMADEEMAIKRAEAMAESAESDAVERAVADAERKAMADEEMAIERAEAMAESAESDAVERAEAKGSSNTKSDESTQNIINDLLARPKSTTLETLEESKHLNKIFNSEKMQDYRKMVKQWFYKKTIKNKDLNLFSEYEKALLIDILAYVVMNSGQVSHEKIHEDNLSLSRHDLKRYLNMLSDFNIINTNSKTVGIKRAVLVDILASSLS
ncbi:hypothetical protein ACQKE9_19810 [Shewanella vesiculosa]|uniref:hypothetical protein n=1 Tax=Shewanella vesiculosa TaxID=518738 RepID=UPI003D027F32